MGAAILNGPNLITMLRIGAIPLFLILLTDGRYTEALLVFVLAGVTDSLDGALARFTNSRTTLGAYIDPLADKLLLVSSFLFLTFAGFIPRWLTIVVISRDVLIVVGFALLFVMTGQAMTVKPTLIGKACTFFQLLTVTLTLVSLHNPSWTFPLLWHATLMVTGSATVVSGWQYLSRGLLWLNQQGEEHSASAANDRPRSEGPRRRYSV
ncbi:MAG: CDP-alcohol phosphatidyltransferase family protein [Candidatus Binatia bacterium]|nr:CDP-alcohol phosphatidyltransferase family protein [Candidatus Binatia bacterium]